jgi:hypothetical protein
MTRRLDFPSWSWAGWHGPIDPLEEDTNPSSHHFASILIQHGDGQPSKFDAICMESLSHYRELASPRIIHIEALVLAPDALCQQKLPIVHRESYYEWRIGRNFLGTLDLSRPEDYHAVLQYYFSKNSLQGIVLLENLGHIYVLIVRETPNGTERAGRMRIRERRPPVDDEEDWDLYEDQNAMHFSGDDREADDWEKISLDEATQRLDRLKRETGSCRRIVALS